MLMMRMTSKTLQHSCLSLKVMLALLVVVGVGLALTMEVSVMVETLVEREAGVGPENQNVVVDLGGDEEGAEGKEEVVVSLGGEVEVEVVQ